PVAGQDAERRRVLVDQFLEFGRTPVLDGHGHDYRPPVGPDGSTKKGRPSGRPPPAQDATALEGGPPLRHTMHGPRIAKKTLSRTARSDRLRVRACRAGRRRSGGLTLS